jgi:transposase
MRVVYRRSAGLDVHEKSVFVCARILRGKQLEVIEATFPTFTEDLEALRDWLVRHRIQRVAMESTGVYWIPVWNILERSKQLKLILLNPQHVKALPGHKTDRVDAARIAELTQYDLVRASFVPPPEIRELRDLVRRRVHLVEDRNRVSNRIHRLLELQNIKLSSVLTKMTTKTARSILEGLAASEWIRPESLALLATHKRVRGKREQLARALRSCRLTDHFRFLLRELLEELDRFTAKIATLEARIEERMQPYQELIGRLCEIPGVERITAWTLISEIGVDMERFPDSGHLASWCGLCPGNAESAGKRHSGRTGKGNRYVRRVLVQSAWAAARIVRKRNFFTALFYRVSSRAGMKKAAVAVAHRILVIVYSMIRSGTAYREQGADYFDRLHPERTKNRLTARLEQLGFLVHVESRISGQNQLNY